MNKQINALKLALEALEWATSCMSFDDFDDMPEALEELNKAHQTITAIKEALAQPERHELQADGKHQAPCARFCEANAFQIEIRRLKAQLAQPEQIPPSAYSNTHQPEQEAAPVAKNEGGRITWMIDDWPQNCLLYTHTPQPKKPEQEQLCYCGDIYNLGVIHRDDGPCHYPDHKEPEQEPVAWRNAAIRVGEDLCSVGPFGYYDMTASQWLDWALSVVTAHAPPQRTWVGLTDEEIAPIIQQYHWLPTAFVRAVEAKLKEKNT